MAVLNKTLNGSFGRIVEYIDKSIQDKGITTRQSAKIINQEEGNALLVYDRYYMRSSSWITLSIMITKCKDFVKIDAVSSGGASGVLMEHSYGSEEKFLEVLEETIKKYR